MNLAELSIQVNRLLANIWAIIAFFKEYLVDPAKDVSITFRNADNTETVNTFPNIAKQVETGLSSGVLEKVSPIWAIGVDIMCTGSDGLVYFPNESGDPANNNPVSKVDDSDWFGGFSTVSDAMMFADGLYIKRVVNDATPKLGGSLDCNFKTINKSAFRQIADASPASGTTHIFDYNNGDMQKVTFPAGGSVTLSFSNFPVGVVSGFVIDMVDAGNCTINHPAGMVFTRGEAPAYTVAGADRVTVLKDKNGELSLSFNSKDKKVMV